MHNWVKIFETSAVVESEIIIQMLEANGIEAVGINKTDRSYPVFGVVEIYCKPESAIEAIHLIKSKNEE